jgi:type I restriction enzyme, S subunit
MSNKQNPQLVPKIRFPEFQESGSWTIEKLGSVASISTEKVGSNTCVPMSITSGVGLVSQEDKFGRVIAGDSYKNYLLLKPNDFAYNKSSTKEYPEGFLTLYSGSDLAAVPNSIFTCFRVNGESPETRFLNYQFSDNLHGRWLRNFIQVGARANGALSINDGDLMALPVPMPSGITAVVEQKKIADCLNSLDELIAAQARKVEALKTHKKGLMQQLFPREGETQPRLRFSEFRNAGEWVIEPIGDNVELLSGYPFDGSDISQDCSGVPLLRGVNVTEGRVRHNAEIDRYFTGSVDALEKYKLQLNDLVIGMDGSKVGKNSALITTIDAGALLIQRVARLRAKSIDLIRFIFQQINSSKFHRYVDKINTSSGIPHISAKQIREFCIAFPSDLEQQRISDCLTSLDTLITAATQKLERLKIHKQGLMQQLFPLTKGA